MGTKILAALALLLLATNAHGQTATATPTATRTATPTVTVTPTPKPTVTMAAGYVDFAQRTDTAGRARTCKRCRVQWKQVGATSYADADAATANDTNGLFRARTLTASGMWCFKVTDSDGWNDEFCQWVDVADGQYRKCRATDNAQGKCCETVQSGDPDGVWVGLSPCDTYIDANNGNRWKFGGTIGARFGWTRYDTGTGGGGGSGSVTSVNAAAGSSILTTSGGPVTTSGTLTIDLATQSANCLLAGPASGGAAKPTCRSQVLADLPTLSSADLASKVSDETGSGGGFVRATAPTVTGATLTLPILGAYTVAGLPSAASNTNALAIVTDAANAGSCTSGGNPTPQYSLCRSTGSAWAPVGGGGDGGSGDVTGPATATAQEVAVYTDATGKAIKRVPAQFDSLGRLTVPDQDTANPNYIAVYRNTVNRACSSAGAANRGTFIDVLGTGNRWCLCDGTTQHTCFAATGSSLAAANTVLLGIGDEQAAWVTIPNCPDIAGNHLNSGYTCSGGANDGALCTASSECPSGTCRLSSFTCGNTSSFTDATPTATRTPTPTPTPTSTAATPTATPTVTVTPTPTVTATPGPHTNFTTDSAIEACYNFESGGIATDSCTSDGNADNFTNATAAGDTGNFKWGSQAADFEESESDEMTCTNAECPSLHLGGAAQEISVCSWVRAESADTGNPKTIYWKGKEESFAKSVQFRILGTSALFGAGLATAGTPCSAGYTTVSSTTAAAVNTWYHVCFTYDQSNLKLYVNGALEGTTAYTGGVCSVSHPARIGSALNSSALASSFMDGALDELVVFSRDLTASEVCGICKWNIDGGRGSAHAECACSE